MGSSYRTDLNNGRMPEWEASLREAIAIIDKVADDVSGTIGDDGQYDNAADDGALAEALRQAIRTIRAELPMTPQERLARMERLKRELAALAACEDHTVAAPRGEEG